MAEVMKLKDILSDLESYGASGMQKVAEKEEKTANASVSDAKNELVAALNSATSVEKTASAQEPVTDRLVKVAEDLASSEGEMLAKEAQLYGAAVADGFMARLNQYEQAAGSTKVASVEEESFEKFAEENPEITKQAVELGYLHGKMQIEQMKQAAFQQGYADADTQIQELAQTKEGQEKLAAIVEEIAGDEQEKTASAFEKWAQTEEGRAAMPYVQQGYQDAAEEINKIASDTFERGYNDTIRVLRAL